jgi:Ni/Co efflux regulator RcnB
MNDELLKKLEQKMNRRNFLRGSALAAAAFAAFPLAAAAQDQQVPTQNTDKDKTEKAEKDRDKDDKNDKKDEKAENKEQNKDGDAEKDPFKEIKLDAQGREYRMCPQCGYNMYKQDRTWTCENCGYSYVE